MPSSVPISMFTEARVFSSPKLSLTNCAISGEVVVTLFSVPSAANRSIVSPISENSALERARSP